MPDSVSTNNWAVGVPDPTLANAQPEPELSSEETATQTEPTPAETNGKAAPETTAGVSAAGTKAGDLLDRMLEQGLLNATQVEEIRRQQAKTGRSAGDLVLENQWVDEDTIRQLQAEINHIPLADLDHAAASPQAMMFIPKQTAERFTVLPLEYNQETNQLTVAMADPLDLDTIAFLEKKTRTTLKVTYAPRSKLTQVIKEWYGVSLSTEVKQILQETETTSKEIKAQQQSGKQQAEVIRQAPISKIVNHILEYAIENRASDVHIEPQEERTRVRYRIDGVLQEKLVLPAKVHDALVSKIKILSNLKIDEKRLPQDGRFSFSHGDVEVDLRVSTLPTVHGEKVVMRLLKKNQGALTFQQLGMRGLALKQLEEAIVKPNGIILITGPTGSGKTTTLYSILSKINHPQVNIMTLEDPVEYQIEGVNQVQVNPQIGLTFASGLRSFLRQDPNIIMVGEIRDQETAELAIQASLTGHLVFSTLHTNSAAGAIPRLLDMGAEAFLIASSLLLIMAQRVVRKVCTTCQETYQPPPEVVENFRQVLGDLMPKQPFSLKRGKGCAECGNSGYLGRIGIYEVLLVTEKISRMILEKRTADEIEQVARENGMLTMVQDGYLKAIEGITTPEEVLRVAQE